MGKEVWLGVQDFMAIMENGPHCLDNDVNDFLPSEFYSTIHKAAGSLVTSRSQKSHRLEPPAEVVPSLTASQLEHCNDGIEPGKSWNGWEP